MINHGVRWADWNAMTMYCDGLMDLYKTPKDFLMAQTIDPTGMSESDVPWALLQFTEGASRIAMLIWAGIGYVEVTMGSNRINAAAFSGPSVQSRKEWLCKRASDLAPGAITVGLTDPSKMS